MDPHIERRRQEEVSTVAETAAAWLLELEKPGKEQRVAFLEWIAESPLHVEAVLWAMTMDRMLTGVDPQREIPIEHTNVVELAPQAPKVPDVTHQFHWRWLAAAAATAALAVGGWWFISDPAGRNTYATAVGEQRSVALADGSTVHINTGSRIDVRFSPTARDVRLVAGEALFNVERDPARPFRVLAGETVVQAVGTQFNVYRHAANTTVAVIEGRVRISGEPQSKPRTIAAGEQASVAANGRVTKQARADVSQVTAWRQRRLLFSNDTLGDIAAEFNRYNEKPQIRVEGPDVRERRYAAGFDADDPESLLQVLAKDPTLAVEQSTNEIIIHAR